MNRLFVISDCGGVGRTTVAANLAHALAARGERIRLRDDDPQRALAVHFRSLAPPGDTCGGAARIAPPNPAHRPLAMNLDLATSGGIELGNHPAIGSHRIPAEHGLEIVDTPARWSTEPRQLDADDYALCVIAPEARCFRTLPSQLKRHADAAGHGLTRNFLGLINAFEPESTLARDTVKLIEDAFGSRLLPGAVMRDTTLAEAFAGGLPIAEYAPWSQAADAFGRVADTLIAMRAATHVAA